MCLVLEEIEGIIMVMTDNQLPYDIDQEPLKRDVTWHICMSPAPMREECITTSTGQLRV